MIFSRQRIAVICLASLALVQRSNAWISSPIVPRVAKPGLVLFSTSEGGGIESLSLQHVSNHEEEGEKLAKSIAAWLDAEWMPQEVHVRMGASAKKSYIQCRETGDDDLMAIMTTIADDLSAKWNEYDKDAFINAYDIANYASDYLVQLSGSEGCECSAKIY